MSRAGRRDGCFAERTAVATAPERQPTRARCLTSPSSFCSSFLSSSPHLPHSPPAHDCTRPTYEYIMSASSAIASSAVSTLYRIVVYLFLQVVSRHSSRQFYFSYLTLLQLPKSEFKYLIPALYVLYAATLRSATLLVSEVVAVKEEKLTVHEEHKPEKNGDAASGVTVAASTSPVVPPLTQPTDVRPLPLLVIRVANSSCARSGSLRSPPLSSLSHLPSALSTTPISRSTHSSLSLLLSFSPSHTSTTRQVLSTPVSAPSPPTLPRL